MPHDPFGAAETIATPLSEREISRLDSLSSIGDLGAMPYSIKVLLESALRNCDGGAVSARAAESASERTATST